MNKKETLKNMIVPKPVNVDPTPNAAQPTKLPAFMPKGGKSDGTLPVNPSAKSRPDQYKIKPLPVKPIAKPTREMIYMKKKLKEIKSKPVLQKAPAGTPDIKKPNFRTFNSENIKYPQS